MVSEIAIQLCVSFNSGHSLGISVHYQVIAISYHQRVCES